MIRARRINVYWLQTRRFPIAICSELVKFIIASLRLTAFQKSCVCLWWIHQKRHTNHCRLRLLTGYAKVLKKHDRVGASRLQCVKASFLLRFLQRDFISRGLSRSHHERWCRKQNSPQSVYIVAALKTSSFAYVVATGVFGFYFSIFGSVFEQDMSSWSQETL